MAKAILLLSGGLDSTLAGKLLLDMGISVEAVNFVSPFCTCTPKSMGCSAAQKAAGQLGIPVKVFSTGDEYIDIIKRPRFGRGKGMNPCLDCRIFIFSRAKKYMEECGADFIATGEVLGERPMSQRRQAIEIIERESGLNGLILRPLCAQLFPPTKPEIEHLVDRNKLLDIQGRCRKPQIDLAEKLGIRDFLCPAGGCLLTDLEFSARLKDLMEYDPEFSMNSLKLLKVGRHFRINSGVKIVVGRNEQENDTLERLHKTGDILLLPLTRTGPNVLCRGQLSDDDVSIGAGLLATYTKGGIVMDVEARVDPTKRKYLIRNVLPLKNNTHSTCRIGIAK